MEEPSVARRRVWTHHMSAMKQPEQQQPQQQQQQQERCQQHLLLSEFDEFLRLHGFSYAFRLSQLSAAVGLPAADVERQLSAVQSGSPRRRRCTSPELRVARVPGLEQLATPGTQALLLSPHGSRGSTPPVPPYVASWEARDVDPETGAVALADRSPACTEPPDRSRQASPLRRLPVQDSRGTDIEQAAATITCPRWRLPSGLVRL